MDKLPSSEAVDADKQQLQQLQQLRELLLGKDHQLIADVLQRHARGMVGSVLTEALHDRQKQDGTIDKVLQPIVESSVEQSVSSHSDRLIGYLYPLVGSLVRKSVRAFLTDFIEKTNQLLENSLTVKGIKWRIRAKQAGVSFAQYAASQTFVYRVEHLLLIHRETGMLLNSVNYNEHNSSNVDVISSMLSAINDFVADSFTRTSDGNEEQLQTISTDNFTLLIKPGPYALMVAAVTGNAPQQLNDKMQIILENLHRLYDEELRKYDGDATVFTNTESQLRECLLAEHKDAEQQKKKTPWMALVLIGLVTVAACWWGVKWWQSQQLEDAIREIDQQPGIVLQRLSANLDQSVSLDILRDPDAIAVDDWLQQQQIQVPSLNLRERHYHALDGVIVQQRAQRIVADFPDVVLQWQGQQLVLTGNISASGKPNLLARLQSAGFSESDNLDVQQLGIQKLNLDSNHSVLQQMFKQQVGKVTVIQLDFDVASDQINASAQLLLDDVSLRYQHLKLLADSLGYQIGLVIIGTSDQSGSRQKNERLSQSRASNTESALIVLGLNSSELYSVGLGQIEVNSISANARKVLFNVIYLDNIESKEGQEPQ
ncbi:OmpA family protein [Alteromonadaceae bacterium BrNp21-10]|nr:OmpA family protein [Alteromonadaceae bacterium BrNp21-10]